MSIEEIKDIKKLQQMLKSELELRKYTYKCCQEAGEELAKNSFAWDGKEKNLVIQAMELNERFEAKKQECEELKKANYELTEEVNIDRALFAEIDQLKAYNEELKKVNEEKNELLAKLGCPTIATSRRKVFVLQQQLDQLKEQLNAKEQECERLRFPMQDTNYAILAKEEFEEYKKFKQALIEIKDVVKEQLPTVNYNFAKSMHPEMFNCYEQILQKIKEVMPDEN